MSIKIQTIRRLEAQEPRPAELITQLIEFFMNPPSPPMTVTLGKRKREEDEFYPGQIFEFPDQNPVCPTQISASVKKYKSFLNSMVMDFVRPQVPELKMLLIDHLIARARLHVDCAGPDRLKYEKAQAVLEGLEIEKAKLNIV